MAHQYDRPIDARVLGELRVLKDDLRERIGWLALAFGFTAAWLVILSVAVAILIAAQRL